MSVRVHIYASAFTCVLVSVEASFDRSGGVLVDFKLTKDNLELRVLLPVPPKCCGYRHVPPLLAQGKSILRFTLLLFICACVYQPHLCGSCGGHKALDSLS